MTEGGTTGFPEAEQAVLARLAADVSPPSAAYRASQVEFVQRVVEYSFIELARHRARLRAPLFAIPGVVSLSVDEEFNRIKIGLEDPAARETVLDLAMQLAVPAEMLSFSEESPAKVLHMSPEGPDLPLALATSWTLDDSIPDGKLRGGYSVQAEKRDRCTLAFPAVLRSRSATEVFVSSAHCSTVPFVPDGYSLGQPDIVNVVGFEIRDPGTHRCDEGPRCRHSDAALNLATADIAFAEIGRPREKRRCGIVCGGAPTTVDPSNPVITITDYSKSIIDGETLHKIGRVTGWSYSEVTDTCTDVESDDGVVRRCTGLVRLGAVGGDSGAPVFRYKDDGTAQLKGIVWGGSTFGKTTLFSNYERIERDLGGMWVYDPGPPVIDHITGPPYVPRGYVCGWTTTTHGMDPATPLLVGSHHEVHRYATRGVGKSNGVGMAEAGSSGHMGQDCSRLNLCDGRGSCGCAGGLLEMDRRSIMEGESVGHPPP